MSCIDIWYLIDIMTWFDPCSRPLSGTWLGCCIGEGSYSAEPWF